MVKIRGYPLNTGYKTMHKYRPFLHMLLILMFLLQVVSATPQSHGTQGEDGSAAGVAPAPTAIATPGTGQIPLGGQPRPIPGVVEAEFYDIGGEGVAYHDTTPGNTGGEYRSDDVDLEYKDGANLNVGWGADGEWIEYTMDVAKGEYVIDARLACADSGRSPAVSMGGCPSPISMSNCVSAIRFHLVAAWTT